MPRPQDDHGLIVRGITGPLFEVERLRPPADPFVESPFPPTDLERRVGTLIQAQHRGRDNPVSLDELKRVVGLGEREIKKVIERLRSDYRMRIGARRTPPVGYFLVVDAADAEEALKPYRRQVVTMLRTMRVLADRQAWLEMKGQLRIELE